jgi:hypothetical protein
MPYKRQSPGELAADITCIGSAFFIARWGAFLTARHLVEDYFGTENEEMLAMLLWEVDAPGGSSLLRCAIRDLELHPTLDVAFGVAAVSPRRPPPRPLTLSRQQLAITDPISVFGYAHTRAVGLERNGLLLEFWPNDQHGRVIQLRTPIDTGYRGYREYVVDAKTLGGASGAPVVSRATLEAHAIVSSGIGDACGFATDVRAFVDSWSVRALRGTIAAHASQHPGSISIRG